MAGQEGEENLDIADAEKEATIDYVLFGNKFALRQPSL
jgi:hypothetical protein